MIFAYVLLAILICTAATIICTMGFGMQKDKMMRSICMIGLILCMIGTSIFGICHACANSDTKRIVAQYEDLMLYYNTVNYSSNEYVRYDYYNKVQAYNTTYQILIEATEDPVFGCLYPKNWYADIGPIDFQLHGDEYAG
jgi:hypothetical protein